ncbi:LSU ribosomal protein L18P/ diadenosine tetraphosphatase [Giardia duodenalis assemblage B]|uniref:LSU ribosomal protein L18P/ diadenosine tetraphosphatase n=1 Tax=Giardia duodenalis assemblage B TaxID=1394984 RepID=A0A132NN52_GIAIN|nr:LSU ribosomal protein L18P/ diadenosine tetraphosphatase [Giardia intestinalis assemblage B]
MGNLRDALSGAADGTTARGQVPVFLNRRLYALLSLTEHHVNAGNGQPAHTIQDRRVASTSLCVQTGQVQGPPPHYCVRFDNWLV